MGGFLRMIVYADTGSDAEFVRAARSEAERTGRSRSIQMLLGLAALTLGIAAVIVAVNLFSDLSQPVRKAATAGLFAGFGAGALLTLGYKAMADCRRESASRRMAQLLVNYHDQLASRGLLDEEDG
jgi:hypothetical protein